MERSQVMLIVRSREGFKPVIIQQLNSGLANSCGCELWVIP